MYLLVGLGNPGDEYKNTRHNVGFSVVDQLILDSGFQISDLRLNRPLQAELLEAEIERKKVIFAKPTTYMNNSGLAVKKLVASYESQIINDVIVVHDDVTMGLGQVKISYGKSAANHNGVQSVIDHLNTDEFVRVRCGIGRGEGIMKDVVLSKFKPEEKEIVEKMIEKASKACLSIVHSGIDQAMNEFN